MFGTIASGRVLIQYSTLANDVWSPRFSYWWCFLRSVNVSLMMLFPTLHGCGRETGRVPLRIWCSQTYPKSYRLSVFHTHTILLIIPSALLPVNFLPSNVFCAGYGGLIKPTEVTMKSLLVKGIMVPAAVSSSTFIWRVPVAVEYRR